MAQNQDFFSRRYQTSAGYCLLLAQATRTGSHQTNRKPPEPCTRTFSQFYCGLSRPVNPLAYHLAVAYRHIAEETVGDDSFQKGWYCSFKINIVTGIRME